VTRKLRRLFPKLFGGEYRLISKKTKRYNCLAWAAEHNDAWWGMPPDGVSPDDVLHDETVEGAIRLFEHLGFSRTDDASLTPGVLKVAIYGDTEGYTHAARQLPNGKWTSKIGKLQDIEHDSLAALTSTEALFGTVEDKAYGQVVRIMTKAVKGRGREHPRKTAWDER
jgi:hypothetical protein